MLEFANAGDTDEFPGVITANNQGSAWIISADLGREVCPFAKSVLNGRRQQIDASRMFDD